MNIFKIALITFLLSSNAATATLASEDSIRELLVITQIPNQVDAMSAQLNTMLINGSLLALTNQTPNPSEQQTINNMKNEMFAPIQGELAWGKLEPIYLRLYKETFTEEEIAGMLAFYKTPAGQAVIYKVPALRQKTALQIQAITSDLTSKIHAIQLKFVTELTAAKNK